MEVREPIRYIDEFNHGKGKNHGLTPPISALAVDYHRSDSSSWRTQAVE
jgi:hypothetical protein